MSANAILWIIGLALLAVVYVTLFRKPRPRIPIVPTPADERPWRDPYTDDIADKIGRRS